MLGSTSSWCGSRCRVHAKIDEANGVRGQADVSRWTAASSALCGGRMLHRVRGTVKPRRTSVERTGAAGTRGEAPKPIREKSPAAPGVTRCGREQKFKPRNAYQRIPTLGSSSAEYILHASAQYIVHTSAKLILHA